MYENCVQNVRVIKKINDMIRYEKVEYTMCKDIKDVFAVIRMLEDLEDNDKLGG